MTLSDMICENWDRLSTRAQNHIRKTRPALLNRWKLIEEGNCYDVVEAESAAAALRVARRNVDRDNYDPDGTAGTMWIDICVRNEVTGEEESETVALEPVEPDCEDGETHDWQSPHEVLGGMAENPGVFAHGGGVRIKTVCAHCGRYRIVDTWAQRPDTGQQGLESVEYEDADEDSMAWIFDRKKRLLERAR